MVNGQIKYVGEVTLSLKNNNGTTIKKFVIHNNGTIKLFRALVTYLADAIEPNSTPRYVDIVSESNISALKRKIAIGSKQVRNLTTNPQLYMRAAIRADEFKYYDECNELRIYSGPNDATTQHLAAIALTDEVKQSISTCAGLNYTLVCEYKISFVN
mgnify:CR=1 FL=1